ncbi:MAG: glycosyltransferase family 39 protein [Bacteroidales bacterium]|jgi:hypothetical protein|nr:glycosyltransferase family 39 protein [Bacteroidales bacterium]NCU34667.1 glycosyltransferase family 39 protein [Candidatus Falkowbacteria bacterium]MDD3525741.1 glycosyltransferase family 39 protein [Bacteroidales bacterium]MDD4176356.1 glycosyltransferase family 39 protein [Bacteroidales bacterium]MDD4741161.1 glycosyltransferase family 39 protein [Bacteroidales bacterium]
MKPKHENIFAAVVIVLLGAWFQNAYINDFPSHTHAWAQADRYALALGFIRNDFNFFEPETFVYNHQFPDDWEVPSPTTITAVDFPMHDFVPAVFMKLLGTTAPWVFRVYVLLYSFLGLFFLFKTAKLLTASFYKSLFVVIFAATSPVFVYYQNGFLPTIPSLANAIIGVYFYIKYLAGNRNSDFYWSMLFLTLGALSRTTFAIPFIAILGLEFLRVLRRKAGVWPKIIPVLASALVLFGYFFYNNYLRAHYGSIFLNHILPARSLQEFIDIIVIVKERWLLQYFSAAHYFILLSLMIAAMALAATKKSRIATLSQTVLFLTVIMLIGCIAFALLMFRQFAAHDYYFLDTFFLPAIMLLIIILSVFPNLKAKWADGAYAIMVLLVSIPLVILAGNSQTNRYTTEYWDRTAATVNNFKNAETYLDSLGVAADAKMLVIDAYAPNIPFILMNRKGYAVMYPKPENIQNALSWDYHYIVMQNEFFLSDIYSAFPEVICKTKKEWDNGRIMICTRQQAATTQSLTEYLGLDDKMPVLVESINFDTVASSLWSNVISTSEYSLSGKNAGVLTKEMEFGPAFKTKDLPEMKEAGRMLLLQAYFLQDTVSNVELVVGISENAKNTYYKSYNLQTLLKKQKQWEELILLFQLPKVNSDDYALTFHIWNVGKAELYMDDLQIKVF